MQAKLLHLAYSANIIETSSKRKKNMEIKKICLYGRLRSQSYSLIHEIFKCTVATSAIVIWSSLHIYHLLQLLTNIYPHVPRPVCKTTTPPTCHPHFVGRAEGF